MTTKATTRSRKRTTRAKIDQAKLQAWLESLRSPEIEAHLAELEAEYGTPPPPIEEVRKRLDKQMGKVTLTDLLREIRE